MTHRGVTLRGQVATISVAIVSADGITGPEIGEALDEPAPAGPIALRDLISRNMRRMRIDAAANYEDVSRAARRYGLTWTTQWVAAVERGQRATTAEQLVVLPLVLAEAFGHRVGLADLLLGDDPVLIGPVNGETAPVSGVYLREMVTASPYRRPFSAPGTPFAGVESGDGALARAATKMREISKAGLGDIDIRALAMAEEGAGDLEDKLARKLGVAPIIVIAAAASLWRRSLTEERQAQLTADTFSDQPHPKPAVVMRKLAADVSDRIEQAAARLAAQAAQTELEQANTTELPVVPAVVTPEVPRHRPPISLFSPEPA